jgi:hypothetical protein
MSVRLLAAALLLVAVRPAAGSGVVVLVNRTDHDVTCTATAADGPPRRVTVVRGDLTVLTVAGATTVSFISNNRLRSLRAEQGSVHAFTAASDGLRTDPLLEAPAPPRGAPAQGDAEGMVAPPGVLVLPVKILVDGQEPAVRTLWEARLRKRIAAASEVLEHHCGVRLEVAAVGTWDSSPEAKDFAAQLSDFERKVPARHGLLAIGFSSRPLPADPSAPYVAALPTPLRPHILIGEWFPMGETQRLEVLLHEIGHYLGAVHTKETDSVMRLTPGDGRSVAKNFRIGYDPLNTLAMTLVAREALKRGSAVRKLGAVNPPTRSQLANFYKESARLVQDDPTPDKFLRLLDDVPPARPARAPDPMVDGARAVVEAVVAAADSAADAHLSGDRLTEHYVRAAAAAAGKLPEAQRVPAFLLGLAVALDTSDLLRKAATTRGLWGRVEYEDEREERLKQIGQPAVQGRPALVRHFAVAAALTAVAGSKAADPGGVVRELFDGEPGGAFNFAEVAAELSGGAFARALTDDPNRLAAVATSFTVADYIASPAGLDEALTRDEFNRRYGSYTDDRFREREADVRRRVAELAGNKSK